MIADRKTKEALNTLESGRGRHAERPEDIPAKGWKDVAFRVWDEINKDRVSLVAAGVSFYLMLALFPALAALVSIYGLIADPSSIGERITFLGEVFPAGAMELILEQLSSFASQKPASLSLGVIAGLLVTLWSAHNGVTALFDAMNIAYEETEKRSFIKLTLVSFLFMLAGLFIIILMILGMGILPLALALLGVDDSLEIISKVARWPLMLIFVCAAIASLYRYGPSRERAKLRWLTWGAALSTVAWLIMALGFSFYLENFADFNATYGTLGTFVGFMIWTWLSVLILIVGAELNAELEHQTARDSTVSPEKPMGQRGAHVADTLGKLRQ
ncbi:YihY/virulence factor BrkB family protein [Peteryoungia desertarenae]|uniref:YihY/virulence factor BrkB family protein n=1 Tax=Peteryoungia desertarenae TaxID=1813451 RepID=A0ABX6QIQ4_9HYPH|nr:YihY/virulence factor BrkB family protein [Peteryoungia desertarenae]QLF68449.1 YihY/virulence factor BrkB family protein [Peteryoungia desertarenae]